MISVMCSLMPHKFNSEGQRFSSNGKVLLRQSPPACDSVSVSSSGLGLGIWQCFASCYKKASSEG
jgi:hypothetical protein